MLRRHTAVLALVLVGLLVGAAGCTLPTTDSGGGYGPSGKGDRQALTKPDEPAPVVLKSGVASTLKAVDGRWTPRDYVVAPDASIVLRVANNDSMQHNFTLDGANISRNVPTGSQALIRFSAPSPGKHRFYCKYQRQEMQGWITVQ
jgi:Cupredoxin-like domain